MSYQRKKEDNRRLKKMIVDGAGWWPSGAYEAISRSGNKTYLKRYWKSQGKKSCWAWNKKQSHRKYRRFIKENEYFTKKAYDLWWNVW